MADRTNLSAASGFFRTLQLSPSPGKPRRANGPATCVPLSKTSYSREIPEKRGVTFDGDWGTGYLSPLLICRAILAPLGDFTALAQTLHITKTAQFMPDGTVERGVH